MRRLIGPLLLCVFSLSANQSINIPIGGVVNMVVPNSAPFAAPFQNNYLEMRFDKLTLPTLGTTSVIGHFGPFTVTLDNVSAPYFDGTNQHGKVCSTAQSGGSSDDASAFGATTCVFIQSATLVGGFPDVIIRLGRYGNAYPTNGYNGSTWIYGQDAVTGAVFPIECCGHWNSTGAPMVPGSGYSANGTFSIGSADVPVQIAYIGWGTNPPSPPTAPFFRNESSTFDLAAFRFEGSCGGSITACLTDTGTGGYGTTMSVASGVPTIVTSTVEPPMCLVPRQYFRAGVPATLANYSYPLNGGTITSYYWKQVAGNTVRISDPTSATPTLYGGVLGPVTLTLTIKDSSGTVSSCTTKHGFSASDASGNITTGDTRLDDILLGGVRNGLNPLDNMDAVMIADGDKQVANLSIYYPAYWRTPAAGTIQVTKGSTTVPGTGTAFQSLFCTGPGSTTPKTGANITIWYQWNGLMAIPLGTGRRTYAVGGCPSDTSLTLTTAFNLQNDTGIVPNAGTSSGCGSGCLAGLQYNYSDGVLEDVWNDSNTHAGFYSYPIALFALYFETGIDDYLLAARQYTDRDWEFTHDSGRMDHYVAGFGALGRPSDVYRGVFAWVFRAIEGCVIQPIDCRTDMWQGLEMMADGDYRTVPWSALPFSENIIGNTQTDLRGFGNTLLPTALVSEYDPTSGADAIRANLNDMVTRGIMNLPDTSGEPPLLGKAAYNYNFGGCCFGFNSWEANSTVHLINGSTAGTCNGTCNFQNTVANGSQFWGFYSCGGGSCTGVIPHNNSWFIGGNWQPTHGSPAATAIVLDRAWTGSTGDFGYLQGYPGGGPAAFTLQPFMLGGFAMPAMYHAMRALTCTGTNVPANCDGTTLKTAALATYLLDDANFIKDHATSAVTYAPYYFAGSLSQCYTENPNAATNPACTNGFGVDAARMDGGPTSRGVIETYKANPTAGLKSFLDNLMTRMWSRPGTGVLPGQANDFNYLKGFDEGFGAWMSSYSFNGTNYFPLTPPANGQPQKYPGMGLAQGSNQAWISVRNGGIAAGGTEVLSVPFNLASVPTSTSVDVTVTEPYGTTTTTNCTNPATCLLTVSANRGGHNVTIQYKNAGGVVLRTSLLPLWHPQ